MSPQCSTAPGLDTPSPGVQTFGMQLTRKDADVYVPDRAPFEEARSRCRLMGVAAHPDDLEIVAFESIVRGRAGEGFCGVVLGDGAGSPRAGEYAALDDAEMARVRLGEQRQAADAGAYGLLIQLRHPSSAVKDSRDEAVVDDLEAVVRELRPREIVTHDLSDRHDTHVAALLKLLRALRRLPPELRPGRLTGCGVWRDLDWLSGGDRRLLDVSGQEPLAVELIGAFRSQIGGGKRYDLGVLGRRRAQATFTESHATDAAESLMVAMDLTPLLVEGGPTPLELWDRYVAAFRDEVRERLVRLGA